MVRFVEILNESIIKLGPQLYAPHPKSLDSSSYVKESFNLKPKAKVWTSTAIKTKDGYTSEWVRWCVDNMPGWVGDKGFIFDIDPNAKILQINSDIDAISIAKQYGVKIKVVTDLFQFMPWDKIIKDYDAVHHMPNDRYDNLYMSTWDVESTAIFNVNILSNKKLVKVDQAN